MIPVDTTTPWGSSKARSRRARNRSAKDGSGATGPSGSRRTSSGSVTVGLLSLGVGLAVGLSKSGPGAYEQRLGGMQCAIDRAGDFRHRQVIEIAKRECCTVLRSQRFQCLVGKKR